MRKRNLIAVGMSACLCTSMAFSGCSGNTQGTPTAETSKTETQAETISQTTEKTAGPEQSQTADKGKEIEVTFTQEVHSIVLSYVQNSDGTFSHAATLDGEAVPEYDYTWHADPSQVHDEVKNCPAEYYTGTKPGDEDVYIAHDILYYPEVDPSAYKLVNYDGEQEYVVYYTAEGLEDYIFATLPTSQSGSRGNFGWGTDGDQTKNLPAQMMHSEEEAFQNAVLHITKPGVYSLEGQWHGQILVNLGDQDETFTDENAKVQVLLNGVDVTCTTSPAMLFESAYECDNTWEDREEHSYTVDTTDAGVSVVIADGTENNFFGANVFRMLKTKYKKEDDTREIKVQKKAHKYDGAFYSCVSMNISGAEENTGVLNITSAFEGLNSELHMTINGGNINIFAQDDAVNLNEDGVSVLTVNDGNIHIMGGLGTEGDGIDSNGFILINGGNVITSANPGSDSGMDSDCGTYVHGGTVLAMGSSMDWAEAEENEEIQQGVMNLRFYGSQKADEAVVITDTSGKVVFAYDPDQDEIAKDNTRSYSGAIISSPKLKVGEEYFVYVGGDVAGSEVQGVYDPDTVTSVSADAKQQVYTGSDGFGFGPGGRGGHGGFGEMPPEGAPEDWKNRDPKDLPERKENSDFKEGRPRRDFPEDFRGGFSGGEPGTPDLTTASEIFALEKSVNNFAGVTDEQ